MLSGILVGADLEDATCNLLKFASQQFKNVEAFAM